MIESYFKLTDFLGAVVVKFPEVAQLLLHPYEVEQLSVLFKAMAELDSVTLALQNSSLSFADVRVLFDGVREKYPAMDCYLSPEADIVKCPDFENGLVKLANKQDELLTDDEVSFGMIVFENELIYLISFIYLFLLIILSVWH